MAIIQPYRITIHVSDSDFDHHDDISVIDSWHRERGFRKGGYHEFIQRNGSFQNHDTHPNFARAIQPMFETGAHVRGQNAGNLGICVHGKTRFTREQFFTLRARVKYFMQLFFIEKELVKGHNYYDPTKHCPVFDYEEVIFGQNPPQLHFPPKHKHV